MIDQPKLNKTYYQIAIHSNKQEIKPSKLISSKKYIDLDASIQKNTNLHTSFIRKPTFAIQTPTVKHLNLSMKYPHQPDKSTLIKRSSLNLPLKTQINSTRMMENQQDQLVLMTNLKMRATRQPYEQVNANSKKRLEEKIHQAELKMVELGLSLGHLKEEKKNILQNSQASVKQQKETLEKGILLH